MAVIEFLRTIRTRCLAYSVHLVAILVALGLMAAPPSWAAVRANKAAHANEAARTNNEAVLANRGGPTNEIVPGGPSIGPLCAVSPSSPVGVPAGGTVSFQASNCGSGALTWQVSGEGSIDRSGNYTAPASVRAQNQSRGCQELPNNSPFNIPVDQLPVDPHSSLWLTRISEDGPEYPSYHHIRFFPEQEGFYDNPVDGTTPQELMHFLYADRSNGYQDTDFPIPTQRNLLMEGGASIDAMSGIDRHLFAMNKSTCEDTEIYNLYVDFRTLSFTPGNPTGVRWTTNTVWPIPQDYQVIISGATGSWAAANGTWRMTLTGSNSGTLPFNSTGWGAAPSSTLMSPTNNGCQTCNSAGGQKFHPNSYAMLGGVDAASMPIGALSLKLEEWYAATRAGRSDLGHAIRTTLSNAYLSARNIWPAAGYANYQDILTGATNQSNPTFTALSDISALYSPCDNYTYTTGCQFHIVIFGLTGAWAAANGDQAATAVDNYHFTVAALNTTTWGPFPAGYGVYFVPDVLPYGATIRLQASFDVDTFCSSTDLDDWCPYAKVYLRTLQKYGMVIADGTVPSDNWDNGVIASEFHPNVLVDAAENLRSASSLQPIEPLLEVVNRASQQLSTNLSNYLVTNTNRTTVTVCGTAGCASNDVILQGTTIGTDRERLAMAAGVSYPLNVWVNGNINQHLTYSMDTGISGAYVSSSGVVTMPNCPSKQQGTVTVTSLADPDALPLYIEVMCLPKSSDGGYRLALGNYSGDYVDSTGKTWWGSWANNGFNNAYEAPGLGWGFQNGSWQGYSQCQNDTWTGTDSELYSRSTNANEDTRVDVILPNGTYNLTLYGEPGFGGFGGGETCGNTAGQNVYDWQVQGQTAGSWLDGYVLAGNQPYRGYTLNAMASVTDNALVTVGRLRLPTTYGMSWSSLLIKASTPARVPPQHQ